MKEDNKSSISLSVLLVTMNTDMHRLVQEIQGYFKNFAEKSK